MSASSRPSGWRQHTGKIVAASVLVVCWAFAAAMLWTSSSSGPSTPVNEQRLATLLRVAEAADCRLISDAGEGFNEHTTEPVDYELNPPLSGPHATQPAADDTVLPVEPPRAEELVHAGEHGRIILQFRADASQDVVAALAALRGQSPEHVLLTANPTGMQPLVAATTWGRGITCQSADEQTMTALAAFRDTYRDRGPETVE